MRAIEVRSLEGPDGLALADVAEPDVLGRVVVDVHAAGVSFPDLLMSRGQYQRKPELPFIPGVEVAGAVREAPPESGFEPGDRVAAFVRRGGWAEVVVADPGLVFKLPASISFRSGAGLVMNYLTAQFALVRRAQLREGEIVVVHGAAGGLGTATLQMAKALGATTIGVVSTPEKAELAKANGADEVVLVDQWLADVQQLAGRGVDVVADPVGGDRLLDSLRALRAEGRLLILGFAAGEIPSVPANRLLLKNVDVRGVAWGSLVELEPTYPAEQWATLGTAFELGRLRPVDGPTFPLEAAAEALRLLDARSALGKITLAVGNELV